MTVREGTIDALQSSSLRESERWIARLCDGCTSATPHPFRVTVRDEEGPAWTVTVNAIGEYDARNLAREKARDDGAIEPGVIAVEHDDPWAALRAQGLSEAELRERSGK